MRDKHIANLETQLERIFEGAFAYFLGKRVHAEDVALHLARAMEDGLHPATAPDKKALAPDMYTVALQPDTLQQLQQHEPRLAVILSGHLLELATNAGYKLEAPPMIDLQADAALGASEIRVKAKHTQQMTENTSVLERVKIPNQADRPRNPHFIINDQHISLQKPIINIGRSTENDIVLSDRHVSRHHAQVRLRFGTYTIFDVQSRTGTFVNGVAMHEHKLVAGDVVQIGGVRLVYVEEAYPDDSTGTLQLSPMDDRS